MPVTYYWKTAAIIHETIDTVTIVFDTGKDLFTFQPGQFINLTLIITGRPVMRSYSLSSTPDEDEKPAITVKAVTDGLMSTYIVNHAEEINEWRVEGPHGLFYPDDKLLQAGNIILIGGGSGITPLFAQLKFLIKHTTVQVLLLNANKNSEHVIFGKALGYIEHFFSHRFTAMHIFSQARTDEMTPFKNVEYGRLNKLVLKKILKKLLGPNIQNGVYFLCGPTGLIQLAEATLDDLNIDSGQILKEYFLPPDNKNK